MKTSPDNIPLKTGGRKPSGPYRFLPILVPVFLFASSFVLPVFMFSKIQKGEVIGLGPAAWPGTMLWGIALFAGLWIARDIWAGLDERRKPTLSAPVEDTHYDFRKAVIGLLMIASYGWLLPMAGFALATATFIGVWCYFGSMRNLKIVAPVSIIGTIALLWLFMGLALMPLPRGIGMFESFSIWLLRAVGIY